MMRKIFAPLIGVTLLAAPAFGQETAKPAPSTKAATITDADPAIWVVKDADTTIYLFGTFHALKPGIGWFDDAVKTAFDKSDEAVFEVDLTDRTKVQQAMIALGMSKDGKPFTDDMTPEQKQRYVDVVKSYGMPPTAFDTLQPWMAGVTLSALGVQKAGFDPSKGAEMVLLDAAHKAGKKVGQFETIDEQLGFFASLPKDEQMKFLNDTVKDEAKGADELDAMLKDWSAGDPEALGKRMNDDMADDPKLADILLYNRNEAWAKKIKDMLETTSGTIFVAVGSGHLAGPRSVQADLAKLGVTSQRIRYH